MSFIRRSEKKDMCVIKLLGRENEISENGAMMLVSDVVDYFLMKRGIWKGYDNMNKTQSIAWLSDLEGEKKDESNLS